MSGARYIALTHSELYSEPTNNHFVSNEEDLQACTRAVFRVFHSTGLPLADEDLLQNIQAIFCHPIGAI
jgi:hypothetical protein